MRRWQLSVNGVQGESRATRLSSLHIRVALKTEPLAYAAHEDDNVGIFERYTIGLGPRKSCRQRQGREQPTRKCRRH
jgi:hypothetical protein